MIVALQVHNSLAIEVTARSPVSFNAPLQGSPLAPASRTGRRTRKALPWTLPWTLCHLETYHVQPALGTLFTGWKGKIRAQIP